MTFTGTHLRTLDDKNRLAIPKPFREGLGGEAISQVYLAPETDKSLSIYTAQRFQERAFELQNASDKLNSKIYLRLYYSQAEGVEVDKQGRIRIPDRLINFASLSQDIVLLGVNDHIELWDKNRWDDFLSQHSPNFDDIAMI